MSSSTDLFTLAFSNLRRRKLRAYLTIIGIFIGIASIVALMSLGQGLQAAIMDTLASFGPDMLIIQPKSAMFAPPGALTTKQFDENDYRTIKSVDGVSVVAKRHLRQAKAVYRKRSDIVYTSYFPNDKEARELVIISAKADVETGKIIEPGDTGVVNVGSYWGEEDNSLGKALGVGTTIKINDRDFRIAGIFKKSGRGTADRAMFFTESDFNDLFDIGDNIAFMAVRVAKGADPEKTADEITKVLRKERGLKEGKEDFTVQTPGQMLQSFSTVLAIVQAVVVGIAAISLLVGGIGVMTTMYTAVVERTRDIGIMKAIGARNSDIFTLYLMESGLLGTTGGIIGITLGATMAYAVAFVGSQVLGSTLLKASLTWWLVAGAMSFSFIVGAVAGTFPALQAARIPPVEALRK
jgi:putative ABC transport system permease protein